MKRMFFLAAIAAVLAAGTLPATAKTGGASALKADAFWCGTTIAKLPAGNFAKWVQKSAGRCTGLTPLVAKSGALDFANKQKMDGEDAVRTLKKKERERGCINKKK